MQKIPIKLAAEGMKLDKPVVLEGGMVLAGAGLELDASFLERLKKSGIKHITVAGRPVSGIDQGGIDPAKMRERLDYLFRKHKQESLMVVLRNMIDQYLAAKIEALNTDEDSQN